MIIEPELYDLIVSAAKEIQSQRGYFTQRLVRNQVEREVKHTVRLYVVNNCLLRAGSAPYPMFDHKYHVDFRLYFPQEVKS